MKKGDAITFRGEGDQVPGVRLAGDIIIILDQVHHATFTRKGDHLYLERTISLAEALTGFTMEITHLDGRKLAIRPPAGACIDPDHLWSINREGMPVAKTGGSERGQLVIKFNVKFPESLNEADCNGLRSILGMPPQPTVSDAAEEVYLSKTTVDLNKKQQREEDDDDEPRGQRAGCTQQ